MKSTAELQNEVNNYQTGNIGTVEEIQQPSIKFSSVVQQPVATTAPTKLEIPEGVPRVEKLYENFAKAIAGKESKVYTKEAREAGFGTSRYDSQYQPGMDIEHDRALQQSAWSKIGTGVSKGIVTAGATAVNTTVGTVYGIGAGLFQLATNANGDGRSITAALDAGTNNFITQQMHNLQQWSEKLMPNYRTAEERTDKYQNEWYKHMLTANFIGDSLLKNFGFTIGAMAGGLGWSKLISKGLARKLSGDVMKGAVLAANGNEVASAEMARAMQAIQKGNLVAVDVNKLTPNLVNIGRELNKANAKLQLYGSAISAMGEGSFEGVSAKNEFLDIYLTELNNAELEEAEHIKQELLNSGDHRYTDFSVEYDENGKVVKVPFLTRDGEIELGRRQRQASGRYNRKRLQAEDESEKLATTTYLLNLPILTTSNMIQFGKMFSGGWKAQRAVARSVAKKGGQYVASGSVAGKTILETLKVMASEGSEEMLQGVASSGAKQVARDSITDFNDAGYDAEAIGSVRSWFESMYAGGESYLSDIKNWQEGALGAITGLLGIPGRHWHGGIIGAYNQSKEEIRASYSAASLLNSIVNSKDFQDRWRGYIRHIKYDNEMAQAAEDDNEYAYHTASQKQLINDIIAFADAGRLEDLNQTISAYSNLTAEEVSDIRSMLAESEDATASSWAQNATDKEIISEVQKRAKKVEDEISLYKELYESVIARNPGVSEKLIKETVFTTEQLKSFERRFLTLYSEVLSAIEPYLQITAQVAQTEGNTKNSVTENVNRLKSMYEKLFSGSFVNAVPEEVKKQAEKAFNSLEAAVEKTNPDLLKKVQDLRKLSEARQTYYHKLQTLQGEGAEQKVEEQAITQEQVDEAAQQALNNKETKGLDSIDAVKQAYWDKKGAQAKSEFIDTLKGIANTNKAAASFLTLKKRHEDFLNYFYKHGYDNLEDITATPPMVLNMLNDLFRLAKTEEELINLADNVFPNREQFNLTNQSIFGIPSPTGYDSIKNQIKKAMSAYLNGEATMVRAGRDFLATPIEEESLRERATGPERDAPQPSVPLPGPTPQDAQSKLFTGALDSSEASQMDDWIRTQLDEPSVSRFLDGVKKYENPTADVFLQQIKENESIFIEAGKQVKSVEDLLQKLIDNAKELADEDKQLLYSMLSDSEVNNKLWSYVSNISGEQVEEEEAPVDSVSDNVLLTDTAVQETPSETKQAEDAEQQVTGRLYTNYRTSVPEIDTGEKRKAKEQIQTLKLQKNEQEPVKYTFDLKDFVIDHPEYSLFWNALAERKAFANAAKVKPGSEITFVIDPNFPTDPKTGKAKILVYAKIGGVEKLVTMLSEQTGRYYGLRELRQEIWDEYRAFSKVNPGKVFVFSKHSSVISLNNGVINYDFTGALHKRLQDIPDFDANTPIIFVSRKTENGQKLIIDIQAADEFIKSTNSKLQKLKPGLYYVYNADAVNPVFISLQVQQFRRETMDMDIPTLNHLRSLLHNLYEVIKSANQSNIEEKNAEMHEAIRKVAQKLDLHYLYFNIENLKNMGLCLRVNQYAKKEEDAERWSKPFPLSTFTEGTFFYFLASLKRHLSLGNVTSDNDNDFKNNFNKLFADGLITSAAERMRPKGADFIFNSFDPKTKQFNNIQPKETKENESSTENNSSNANTEESVVSDENNRTVDKQTAAEGSSYNLSEKTVVEFNIDEVKMKDWEALDEKIKTMLQNKGYSEDDWDSLDEDEREKKLRCL